LIKYIKSVLWRVAKRLSSIEDARCTKVNTVSYTIGSLLILGSNTKFCFVIRKYNAASVHARMKSRGVLERTLKENLLLHLDVCEYTAEHELHCARSFKIMLIIIIMLLLCTSSILYLVRSCKNLQSIHIASRTARGLVGFNCRVCSRFLAQFLRSRKRCLACNGETWKEMCFLWLLIRSVYHARLLLSLA